MPGSIYYSSYYIGIPHHCSEWGRETESMSVFSKVLTARQLRGDHGKVFLKVLYIWGSLTLPAVSQRVNHTAASDALPVCAGVTLGMWSGRLHNRPVYVSFPYADSKWQHRNRSGHRACFLLLSLHNTDSKDGLTNLLKWRLAELIYTWKLLPVTSWTLLELTGFKSVTDVTRTLASGSDGDAFPHHLKMCFCI